MLTREYERTTACLDDDVFLTPSPEITSSPLAFDFKNGEYDPSQSYLVIGTESGYGK